MTAAWSLLLMLMGWLPGNGVQGPAINAPGSLNITPPACVAVSEQLETSQRQALTLERSV